VLASALFLAAGAAGSAPVLAADDPLVQLHSPCHQALVEETRAAGHLKSQSATPNDAVRTLAAVDAGLEWNQKACGTIAGRSVQDNTVRRQMHDVNEAFLLSLRGQAQTVLGRPAAPTYAQANRELDACAASTRLPANVRADCRMQIADNRATQRQGGGGTSDYCQLALVAANDAGGALRTKDYASFERAYQRASDGLTANKSCTRSAQMRDVNNAYLLSWKAVADRYLDVPFRNDRDIANPADPFAAPNDTFRKCAAWGPPFPVQARADCAAQLATNQRFLTDYAAQAPLSPGQTAQPLNWQPIDAAFALRPDFVWDAPCKNNENMRCADEEVRDGSGSNGWGSAPSGVATQLDDQRERVLFATMRNCDDLRRLFSTLPPQFACDAFKSSIVLVAAQRKPHQQCDMAVDRVVSVSSPATANPPRDAVRVNYSLNCAPPVAGSSGAVVTKVVTIPRSNGNGEFATVTFEELGGGGPRGGT
jgi:hypothetical protein